MTASSSLGRRLAAGLVAAHLLLGAMSVSAVMTAAPAAAAAVLDQHGAWQGFTNVSDGKPVYGAVTKMNKGGTAAFVVKDDTLSLLLSDPTWTLTAGHEMPVKLTVDHTVFTGTAIVRSSGLVEMPRIYTKMVKTFADGAEMVVDVDNGGLTWTLDLHGFTASITGALRLYNTSF